MRAHLLVLALGALALSVAADAEPQNLPVHQAQQPTDKAPTVVVASADDADATAAPTDAQQQPAPAPKRHARVTSCRCGDQNPSD